MRLAGRVAIVTGAAQGIGLAIATRFAAEGAKLVMVDRNGEKVLAAAGKIREGGVAVIAAPADLTATDDVKAMVKSTLNAYGCVDILVNNAGGSGSVNANEIDTVSDQIWNDVVDSNLNSVFRCCREVIPHMRARSYGRIINVSSGIAKGVGKPTGTAGAVLPYASAKAGVLGLTYTLAKMVAASNITVNAVVPGFVLTEPGAKVREWFDTLPAQAQAALVSRTARGRVGEAGEIASAILFLASEEASYVSGAALDVSGAS
ncbi:MAG: SDR family oxidoreductase [Betaproteobacteria bacterium]|nr:SDR family oxidoreductase [Betaproteobacteria bacterium]